MLARQPGTLQIYCALGCGGLHCASVFSRAELSPSPCRVWPFGAQSEVIISWTQVRAGMKRDPLLPQRLSPRWSGRRHWGELLRNYRIEDASSLDPRLNSFHV